MYDIYIYMYNTNMDYMASSCHKCRVLSQTLCDINTYIFCNMATLTTLLIENLVPYLMR